MRPSAKPQQPSPSEKQSDLSDELAVAVTGQQKRKPGKPAGRLGQLPPEPKERADKANPDHHVNEEAQNVLR